MKSNTVFIAVAKPNVIPAATEATAPPAVKRVPTVVLEKVKVSPMIAPVMLLKTVPLAVPVATRATKA